ncbi:poly(ADP-ribose) glycohydrolase ARH3 [Thermanaeromonas toyohensis ToBE]|uniref:Poly(ADP-ribose) glycohydrolase ARH3 n=1 Tax=Thermanaeromonas toyohensis ToBE TaxID=698762 RepID=A0A1W1VUN3_9FIRM|nr:ADP-ribosylglycohydrolase family protein [Thermanaeromonas toyohensis]SMB97036.1 poly(ADP-ribose) glycohydrolase ARH3 [Thermanaeromonas toyohensis ToBE]
MPFQPGSRDRVIGAFLGTFVGDALGMPVEGWTAEEICAHYGEVREMLPGRLRAGTYTDDTEMMIGLAESLLRCQGIDGDDLARTFCRNFNTRRGYGPGTAAVLDLISQGKPWEEASQMVFPGGSYGNGAAMRVAPVACFYAREPAQLRRAAIVSARVTHAHPLAMEGAALQAYAISLSLSSTGPIDAFKFVEKLRDFLSPEGEEYRKKLGCVEELLRSTPSRDEVIARLGNDSRATHSVCTAIYAFLRHLESFEEALVYAVNLGGDTDTIGAMTGAISGAYHGKDGIPPRWLDKLENGSKGRRYVEELAAELWKVVYLAG